MAVTSDSFGGAGAVVHAGIDRSRADSAYRQTRAAVMGPGVYNEGVGFTLTAVNGREHIPPFPPFPPCDLFLRFLRLLRFPHSQRKAQCRRQAARRAIEQPGSNRFIPGSCG